MALLSSGHMTTDFANGALPALLPFLKDRFSLSYTLVGALVLASQASSSLIQPLFGLWSDHRGAMWLLPGGVALAGVGIALVATISLRAGLLLAVPALAVAAVFVAASPFLRTFVPERTRAATGGGDEN